METTVSFTKAISSFTLSGFREKCNNAFCPKNIVEVMAASIRQCSFITDRIPITPSAMFAKPNSRIILTPSLEYKLNILVTVNAGLDACPIPVVNNLMPAAQKRNHFPIKAQVSGESSVCISAIVHMKGIMHISKMLIVK